MNRLSLNTASTVQTVAFVPEEDWQVNNYQYGTGVAIWRNTSNNDVYFATHMFSVRVGEFDGSYVHYIVDSKRLKHQVEVIMVDYMNSYAILRLKNAPKHISIADISKITAPSKGLDVYTISWSDQFDVSNISEGVIRSEAFTRNGVNARATVSIPFTWGNTERGSPIFDKSTGQLLGISEYTQDDSLQVVVPASLLQTAILSIIYEIRPGNTFTTPVRGSNRYFIGLYGNGIFRPADLINANLNHPALESYGEVGFRANNVFNGSPADDAGISNSTCIWAISDKPNPTASEWIPVNEENSMDTIVERLTSGYAKKRMLRTLNSATVPADNRPETFTVYVLTSPQNDINNYSIKTLELVKLRDFYTANPESIYNIDNFLNDD